MAYVSGGGLSDDMLGLSLKSIGKGIAKVAKAVAKPVAQVAKVVAKPVVAVAKVVAKPIASFIPGGSLVVDAVSSAAGALKKKPKPAPASQPIVAAPPNSVSANTVRRARGAQKAATTPPVKPAVSIDVRRGTRTAADQVQSARAAVSGKASEATKKLDAARDKARANAARLKKIAEAAKGTPAETITAQAANIAQAAANSIGATSDQVRTIAAGVDGAIVGGAAGAAAEESRQGAAEFLKSPAGLATMGAAAVALIALTGNRGGSKSWR